MNHKIALLFDLDGVIIDSEDEYTRIWSAIDEAFPTNIPDFALSIKGQTLPKILNDNFSDPESRKQVEDMLHRLESEMVYVYRKGSFEFIEKVVERGLPRAIVTSSDDKKMNHLFHDIPDFMSLFPLIIDSTKVKRSKPDPDPYLTAAAALNINPERCAVIEDSVQGVISGRAAGAYVIGVIGTNPADRLAPYCDKLVHELREIDLDELISILNQR